MPVCETLGVTYAEFAIGSMAGSIAGILFSLFMAGKMGRGNMRIWMSVCMLIAAGCELALSFMTAIWQYWVIQFVLMFAFTGCMFLPINTLLARWFVDKKGLATGITYAGAGIGGVILSPVLSQCIAASGWRMTYIYIAIASAVCAVSSSSSFEQARGRRQAPLVKREPNTLTGQAEAKAEEATVTKGMTRAEALQDTFDVVLVALPVLRRHHGGSCGISASDLRCRERRQLRARHDVLQCRHDLRKIPARPGVRCQRRQVRKHTYRRLDCTFAHWSFALSTVGIVFACAGCVAVVIQRVASFVGPLANGQLFGYIAFADCYGVVNISYLLGCMVGPTLTAAIRTVSGSYDLAWIVLLIVTLLIEVGIVFALKLGTNLPAKWHS